MNTKTIECPSCGQHFSLEIGTEEAAYKCPKCNAEFTVSLIEEEQGDPASEVSPSPMTTQCLTSAPNSDPTPYRRRRWFFNRVQKTDTPHATNAPTAKADFVTKALLSVIALCLVFMSVMQFITFRQPKGSRTDIQKVELIGYGPHDCDEDYKRTALRVEVVNSVSIEDQGPINVKIDDPVVVEKIEEPITVEKIEESITVEKIEEPITVGEIESPVQINDTAPIDVRINR